jgi:outer membrane receptor protein involved in Fe transport
MQKFAQNPLKVKSVIMIFTFFACLLFGGQVLLAQGTRGTVAGIVRDPNGAVVPNANVRLIDANKGTLVREAQTNENGVYRLVEIEPATYNVVITATGFAEARLVDVKVEPNRNVDLDVNLAVGTATTEITVTAGAELIDRESPTLGTTVDRRRVEGLPLNGRNVLDLALLQPGVNNINPGNAGFGAGTGFRVNGQRGVENNISLDGATNNEVAVGGTIGAQPRPDAVQEFRLLTSGYEAEFGRNTGAIVNVVTKSGTNDFRGNARFFYRPTKLSAARFLDKALAPPNRAGQDLRRKFERKEYGFNIGGPIYFLNFNEGGPTIYDGRNKSFFFVDFERRYQDFGQSASISGLPSTAERAGNFSALGRTITDPATGQPFPGNVIPTSRISPIARYYLQFLPDGNNAGQAQVSANELTENDYFTTRLDHNITSSHQLNYTFNYFNQEVGSPFAFGGASVPGFAAQDLRKTFNHVGRYTYVITPNLVNTFLVSYSRNKQPGVSPTNRTTPSEIGFTANFVSSAEFAGPPRIAFNERGLILGNSIQGPQRRITENIQFQDSLSWILGNHRLKFGFDYVKYKQDTDFTFINQGSFTFSGAFGGNTTGDDFADFLIGNSPVAAQFGAVGSRDYRQRAFAGFAQDSWRVNPNLTLTFGVRYEYNSPLKDLFNRVAYYRPGVTSQLLRNGQLRTPEGQVLTIPAGGRAPFGIVYVGDPDPVLGGTVPVGGVELDKNNFAPRVGFAYTLNSGNNFLKAILGEGQTVLRASYGLYYGAVIGDTALQQLNATGYNGTNAFFFPASGTLADPFAPDPFPNYGGNQGQIANPFLASSVLVTGPLTNIAQPIDPNIETPEVAQFNVQLQRAIGRDFVFDIAYVGTRGRKLYVREQVNPSVGTLIPRTARIFGPLAPAPTVNNPNARRINDDIRSGQTTLTTGGNSEYDGLQVGFQKRLSDDGLSFQLAYTFSKSINDSDTQRSQLDLLDRRAGRALSSDDVPHRFVASFIYELPFFRNTSGFTKRLVDGWSIGGIYQYQSGNVFSIGNPRDIDGTGGAILNFADFGSEAYTTLDARANDRQAFNANSFRIADCGLNFQLCGGVGRRGTSGRNQFRLDNPINNTDLVLAKRTRLFTENTSLELRIEAFNVFNQTMFTTFDANLGSISTNTAGVTTITPNPSFGKFNQQRESRSLQLGIRLNF